MDINTQKPVEFAQTITYHKEKRFHGNRVAQPVADVGRDDDSFIGGLMHGLPLLYHGMCHDNHNHITGIYQPAMVVATDA